MKRALLLFVAFFFLFACKKETPTPDPEETKPVNDLPQLITREATDLTGYSVTIKGSLVSPGNSDIKEVGFVVDTVPGATLERNLNKFKRVLDSAGNFLTIIINIPANKTYYLRAYGQNNSGTGYGNEIHFKSKKEKVYNGTVELRTQQQVIEFGNQLYTRINGSLNIGGSVADLSPLRTLSAIEYALNIQGTTQLKNLKGLDSLEATNNAGFFHGMRIENNIALTSFDGLQNLLGNSGYFYIINNPALTSLKGLNKLSYNHFGDFSIQTCNNLKSLQGLENLKLIDGNLMLQENAQLTDISALGNLSIITDRIYLQNNQSLERLNGLEKITKLEGLEITNNYKLWDLQGLKNLVSLKYLGLHGINEIKELSALKNIKELEYLIVTDNVSLTDFRGLDNLEKITVKLRLFMNTGLVNFSGMKKLTSLNSLAIESNHKLINLQGLNSLKEITADAYSIGIGANDNLESLDGLENLVRVNGDIQISVNPKLGSFCGLVPLFKSGWSGWFLTVMNLYNPTVAEAIANCK